MCLNIESIRDDCYRRGYSCDKWIDLPGQLWPNFVHETDELVLLLEGEIELQFNGKTICPAIGEEVFIPAGVNHTVINMGETKNCWLYGYKYYNEN